MSLKLILTLYLVMSGITALFFFFDKKFAERGARRIPERWLHTLEWLGGWPGALISAQTFRHKRQKLSYMIWLYVATVSHVIGWLYGVSRFFS